ncbi:MAG: hypothetical protein AB7F22_23495 [Reyranella sp.]|uniref:hypothetical protein n=1 Tax=Reyranella sp. TaxID=1929291 RepID=UPI003D0E4F05
MFVIKQIHDVPEDKIGMLTQVAKVEGAVQVTPIQQLDGKFTLVVVFDKPGAKVAAAAVEHGATVGTG